MRSVRRRFDASSLPAVTLLAGRAITTPLGSPSHDRSSLDHVAERIVEIDGSVRATACGTSARLERKSTATG